MGGIAESWVESDDGLRVQFRLRQGLKWSNGEDLTAFDVVASIRNLVSPEVASPNSHVATEIQGASRILQGELDPSKLGVRSIGDNVIEIALERPAPYFLQLAAHPAMQPVFGIASAQVESQSVTPISNGAYKIAEIEIGSSITLSKNDNYWDSSNVTIDTVVYHVIDQNVESLRFDAKEIDITDNVAEAHFSRYRQQHPNLLRVAPMSGIYYYGFNLEAPVIGANSNLRRALSLAIDREELVTNVLGRGEIAAYRFVPPSLYDHRLNTNDIVDTQFAREELARELLAKEGLRNGVPLSFELRVNSAGGHERIALAIASMWKKVLGIDVRVRAEEFKVFIDNVREKSGTEIFRLSWTGDFIDPYSYLQIFETSSSANLIGYSNPRFDKLLQDANRSSDPLRRQELLYAAETLLLESGALIPVYFYVSKHLVGERVVGWKSNLMDIHPSQYLGILGLGLSQRSCGRN